MRIIVSVRSRGYEPVVPGSMHTEPVSYWSGVGTIASIKISTVLSIRSLLSFCGSFIVIVSFRSRACLVVSLDSLKYSNWSVMSIVSFLSLLCC